MLLEYSFITTAEQSEAFQFASDVMAVLGFLHDPMAGANSLSWSRGVKVGRKAKKLHEVPQRVMLSFDRGRITVAATIEEVPQFAKEKKVLEAYLIALANTLDMCIGQRMTIENVRQQWDAANEEMAVRDKKRRRAQVWRITIALLFVAMLFAVVIAVAVIMD